MVLAVPWPSIAAQDAGPHVTDPADDARENDTSASAELARRTACRAGGVVTAGAPTCDGSAPPPPAAGGEPAPPTMEAISATFRDEPDALLVTLELMEVSPRFEGGVRGDGSSGVIYSVCWTTGPVVCSESVVLAAMPSAGEIAVTPVFQVRDPACNDYGRCSWRIESTMEPGSPGRIHWRVPRDILPNGTEGTVLVQPQLSVTRYLSPSGRIVWPAEDGYGYSIRTPIQGAGTSGYAANHYVPVDTSVPGTDYRLHTPAAPPRLDASFDQLEDAKDDVVGGARSDLDVLGLRITETDTSLTLSVQVGTVDTRPADHDVLAGFDLENGRYISWGYTARGGAVGAFAEVCASPGCLQTATPGLRNLPMNLSFEPGEPGWFHATFARDALESPAQGSLVGSVDVTMFTYDERGTQDGATAAGRAQTFMSGATDTLAFAPPWRFKMASRDLMSTTGVFVEDALGDAQVPPDLGTSAGRFDVAYVEAVGHTPSSSRVTIGIADLSSIDVPPRSRGFLYAVSLEVESGQTFMVGFLRTGRAADTQQEFFCSEDTVLFTPSPRDPDSIVRRTITGLITRPAGGAGGSAQRGSLVIDVPHDCFGLVEPGAVQVKRLAGGAFLLPVTGSQAPLPPQALDTVDHAEPFELQAAAVAAPAPAWYVAPFGIEGFWDILGIVGAVVASGVGVIAVRRKRHLLKDYLARVERIVIENESNPVVQERALLQLRQQVKEALILSKLEHAHFSLIDHRIDEALSKARVRSLATTFDELPNRLLRRLQDLLVDGQMSREDHRVFCLMLEETALTDDAKARVRRRLEAWVRQDASDPPRPAEV